MDAYYILLAICLIGWLLSYRLSDFEFLAPMPIILLGLIVSIGLAIIGMPFWNHYPLSIEVVSIVLVGLTGILLGGFVVTRIVNPNKSKHVDIVDSYYAPSWKYALILIVALTAVSIRVAETIQLGDLIGINVDTYAGLARELRNRTSSIFTTDALTSEISFSFLERQLEKVVNMAGFAAAYLLSRGIVRRSLREVLWTASILVVCSGFQIAGGARGMIFYWTIVAFVTLSLQLYQDKARQEKRRLSKRFLTGGVLAAAICIVFMYYAGSLVGRVADGRLIDYVSFYFGGSVPSLQILCDADLSEVNSGIVEMFYGVYTFLFKQGLFVDLPSYSLAWVDCGGHRSNIFTFLGSYYVGFGLLGVFAFSAFSTIVVAAVYRFAQVRMSPPAIAFAGLFCAYAFDFARGEFIFSRLISSSWMVNFLLLYLIVSFLTRRVYSRKTRAIAFREIAPLSAGVCSRKTNSYAGRCNYPLFYHKGERHLRIIASNSASVRLIR